MSIHGCQVIAIDGTHSAGKTTLVNALTAHYRSAGLDVVHVEDPARRSPLIAEIVADPDRVFDLTVELDVLAATITDQIRAAHGHHLLIADKTTANVLAYARLLLLSRPERLSPVLAVMRTVCRTWQPYDLVIRCIDQFPLDLAQDPYRAKVTELQADAGQAVHTALCEAHYPVLDLPPGMTTTERVDWITSHLPPPLRDSALHRS